MHDLSYLSDILIILSISIIVLLLFSKLKLPPITGFILTGIIIGPQGFKLINNTGHVELLAEIGVALLLFGIGVELAISKIKRLWKNIIIGGSLQVGLTILCTIIISLIFELSTKQSIFMGIIIALSSTAIILREMQLKGEVDSPHGQLVLGILVFQDFAVIPAILIIPFLIGQSLSMGALLITLTKAALIISLVLILALLIVPKILLVVAKTRQRQLFILTVFVICLGTAWLVTQSGASLAIGAFLAGLVVSGSEFRHQAISDMIPFREIFSGLFFVSIGMLLSPLIILNNFIDILFLLTLIIVGKFSIVIITAMLMKMHLRTCVISALTLAQIGEFSFILLYLIKGVDFFPGSLGNNLLSTAILSMLLTPFIVSLAPKLVSGLSKLNIVTSMDSSSSLTDKSHAIYDLCDHIIIAGYGFAGRELSLALNSCNIPFIVVDLNSNNVKKATTEVSNVIYGDITSIEVLKNLNLEKAKEIVLLINDANASINCAKLVRDLAPTIFITVRTAYLQDIESLKVTGANDIIVSEREAAVQVSAQVMKRNKVDSDQLNKITSSIRTHSEEEIN